MSLNPITREEKFLAKAGGEDVGELKPITRKEKFLDRIAGGGSGGGSVSWNDLKDKPFEETVEDITISFDCGNTEGLEFVEMMPGYGLYKISDLVPTKEDLLGAAFISNMGNSDILAGDIEIRGDGNIQIFGSIFIVSDYNAINMPITSNGVWFNYSPSMQGMVFDLKYTARTIKTLPEKFLPAGGGSGGAGGGGDVSWNDLKDKPFDEVQIEYNEIFEVPTTDTFVRTAFTIEKFRYKLGEFITWSYDDLNGQFKISKPVSLSTIFRHASVHLYVSLTETDEDGVYTLTLEIANMIGHTINFAVQYDYVDVKTLDPKFLPAGGGGAFIVNFETTDGQTFTADKTIEEIKEAFGTKNVVGVLKMTVGGTSAYSTLPSASLANGILMFTYCGYGTDGKMVVTTVQYDTNGIVMRNGRIATS